LGKENEIIQSIVTISLNICHLVTKNYNNNLSEVEKNYVISSLKAGKVPSESSMRKLGEVSRTVRELTETRINYYKNLKKDSKLTLIKKGPY